MRYHPFGDGDAYDTYTLIIEGWLGRRERLD